MKTVLKFFALVVLFAVFFVLPAILFPVTAVAGAEGAGGGLALIVIMVVDTAIIILLLQRLRLNGFALFFAVVFVFWGLQTFMTQIETWFFREAMPAISPAEMRNLFIRPLITAVAFVPVAMWILGRWSNRPGAISPGFEDLKYRRILVLAIAYVLIYFIFGYYVAWQFEAVRTFYDGVPEKLTFSEQISRTINDMPWIVPFQLLRGVLWVVFGLPAILWLNLSRPATIFMCVVLYGVMPSIQLTLDNPFMPEPVRIAHLLEVGTSNALFGLLIGLALVPERTTTSGGH